MDQCRTAVTNVRSQAAAIRKTTSEYLKEELLKGELLVNGDPKWSEVLSSFQVVARQFSDLADDVDPVLSFFAYKPLRPTANSVDIPTFLSTRILTGVETESRWNGESSGKSEGNPDVHKATVELYNEKVEGISKAYQMAARELLDRLL